MAAGLAVALVATRQAQANCTRRYLVGHPATTLALTESGYPVRLFALAVLVVVASTAPVAPTLAAMVAGSAPVVAVAVTVRQTAVTVVTAHRAC